MIPVRRGFSPDEADALRDNLTAERARREEAEAVLQFYASCEHTLVSRVLHMDDGERARAHLAKYEDD